MTPIKRVLLTLALTAMWSPSFLFIKLAVQDIPPMTMAACRITGGAFILYLIMRMKNLSLPKDPVFWFHALITGLFSYTFPFCLFPYAETTIDSSLAAIFNGTTPMFTALLAQLFVANDRMNAQKAAGILFCAAGLLTLFAPDIISGNLSGSTMGMLAATTAAISYAVSHIYAKKYVTGQKPFVAPTATLTAGALALIPFAIWNDQPQTLEMPSWTAISGVCGLIAFGTVAAFIIYYKLLEVSGPTAVSLVACFFPVGGLILGVLFLGESLTMLDLIASGLILLGMFVVNQVIKLPFLEPKPAETA